MILLLEEKPHELWSSQFSFFIFVFTAINICRKSVKHQKCWDFNHIENTMAIYKPDCNCPTHGSSCNWILHKRLRRDQPEPEHKTHPLRLDKILIAQWLWVCVVQTGKVAKECHESKKNHICDLPLCKPMQKTDRSLCLMSDGRKTVVCMCRGWDGVEGSSCRLPLGGDLVAVLLRVWGSSKQSVCHTPQAPLLLSYPTAEMDGASWLRLLGCMWDHGVRGPVALPSKWVWYHPYGGDCGKRAILTLTSVVAVSGTMSFIKSVQLILLWEQNQSWSF